MLFLTSAPNDSDLVPLFKSMGNLAVVADIAYGDFNWAGLWYNNEVLAVSGDRKKLMDLISCMSTGRYLKQLRDARAAGFDKLFLMLEWENKYGVNQDGLICKRRGKEWVPVDPPTMFSRVEAYLNELHWYMGIQVKKSHTPMETVRQVLSLYWMFQQSPEEHKSLCQFYEPPMPSVDLFKKPSILRRMSKELEGIGWERSKDIEAHFGSVMAMVTAGEKEWERIPGIGKKTARSVVNEMGKDCRRC